MSTDELFYDGINLGPVKDVLNEDQIMEDAPYTGDIDTTDADADHELDDEERLEDSGEENSDEDYANSDEEDSDEDEDEEWEEEEEEEGKAPVNESVQNANVENQDPNVIMEDAGGTNEANKETVVTVSDDKVTQWASKQIERLQNSITNNLKKVKALEKDIASENETAAKKEQQYLKEHDARNKGEHELEKIRAAKKKAQARSVKKQEEKRKYESEIAKDQAQLMEINKNPKEAYTKREGASKTKKKRKINKGGIDPNFDPWNGDDSLSENEAFKKMRANDKKKAEARKKNASIACRHCRFNKSKCDQQPVQCGRCRRKNLKCRYNDPLYPDIQLPPNHVPLVEKVVEENEALLDYYEEVSKYSVWATNPLSGITGYGPRPASEARQNYYRITHGRDPKIYYPPEVESLLGERKAPHSSSKNKAGKGNNSQVRGARAYLRWKRRKTALKDNEVNLAPAQSNEIRESTSTSTSTSTSPTSTSSQPVLPQTHGVSVNKIQLLWANTLQSHGMSLPLTPNGTPIWPPWTLENGGLNDKQKEWLQNLQNEDRTIPLTAEGELSWPTWTQEP